VLTTDPGIASTADPASSSRHWTLDIRAVCRGPKKGDGGIIFYSLRPLSFNIGWVYWASSPVTPRNNNNNSGEMMRLIKFSFKSLSVLLTLGWMGSAALGADQSTYQSGNVEGRHLSPATTDSVHTYTADLNGDGYTDVVLAGNTPPGAEGRGGQAGLVLFNNGDNTFLLVWPAVTFPCRSTSGR
jgi:hypothetical protein